MVGKLFTFLFLLISIEALCQNIENSLLPIYSIQKERISYIHQLDEDENGILWLATNKGLYTFDGNNLSRFTKLEKTLQKASFSYVFVDSKNRVWAGTYSKGLICFDQDKNTTSFYNHRPFDENSIADDRTKFVFEDYKNNIWVATHTSGMNKFDEKKNNFIHFLPSDIFIDKNKRDLNDFLCHKRDPSNPNIEWIGTLDGLLNFDVNTEKFDIYYCDEISIIQKESLVGLENQVRNINFLPSGMYLSTWGGGICTLDTVNNIWDCYKYEPALPKSHVRNNFIYTFLDKQNRITSSIFKKGTVRYNPLDNSFEKISSSILNEYFLDSKGQEWYVFGRNKLFVRTDESTLFKPLTFTKGVSGFYYDAENHVYYQGVQQQSKIIVTDSRTLRSKTLTYKAVHDNGINWINKIYKDSEGQIIFHDNRDLYTIKDDKIVLYFDLNSISGLEEFTSNSALTSFVDSDNEIWIGYKKTGILRVDPYTNNFANYNSKNGMAHSGWVSSFYEDHKQHIWYGSEKSLGYFDKAENKLYNVIDSLRSFKYISSILQDDENVLWIGEGNNVLKLELADDHSYTLNTFSPPHYIGNSIKIYTVDSQGNLWGGSSKGLFNFDTKAEKFSLWGRAYGFRSIIDVTISSLDSMRIATYGGLLMGNAADLFVDPQKTKPSFTYMKLFNKDYNVWQRPFNQVDEVDLNYKQNFITIGFNLVDILNSEDLRFEYRLEGLRDSWVPLGNRNYLELSHLNPGNYSLQIRKINFGDSPSYSKMLKINIAPPFWQTMWFRFLVLGAIGLIIYFYIDSKRQKLKLEYEEKIAFQKKLANVEMMALKSQMNPHFVFNCLNTIKLFVIQNETEKASRYISDFAKLLRTALNDSRLDLTTLQGEIESVKLYIELEKMRFEQRFDYSINYANELDLERYKVPPMMLQPFIENAILHGILPSKKVGELIINISKEEGYFIYSIIDNGVGRVASQKSKADNKLNPSLGINITNDRLNLIKTLYGMEASIKIIDLTENGIAKGTKVEVRIPVIEDVGEVKK